MRSDSAVKIYNALSVRNAKVGNCNLGSGTTIGNRSISTVQSAQLLHNEKEVHPMNPEKPERNVRDYRDDFSFQTVQKLL